MKTNAICCEITEMNCNAVAVNFFKQFDLKGKYDNCDLFTSMKQDLETACSKMKCDSMNDIESKSFTNDFFNNYKSLDKFINCHLADKMKAEMKLMCSDVNDYIPNLKKGEDKTNGKKKIVNEIFNCNCL